MRDLYELGGLFTEEVALLVALEVATFLPGLVGRLAPAVGEPIHFHASHCRIRWSFGVLVNPMSNAYWRVYHRILIIVSVFIVLLNYSLLDGRRDGRNCPLLLGALRNTRQYLREAWTPLHHPRGRSSAQRVAALVFAGVSWSRSLGCVMEFRAAHPRSFH